MLEPKEGVDRGGDPGLGIRALKGLKGYTGEKCEKPCAVGSQSKARASK